MNSENERYSRQLDYGHEPLQIIHVESHDWRRARQHIVRRKQRVAICRTVGDSLRANQTAGTNFVLDDHLLSHSTRYIFADQTSQEVRSAAGREIHNDTYRLHRIGLRARNDWHDRKRGGTCGKLKKLSARKLHGGRSVELLLGGPHRFGLTLSAYLFQATIWVCEKQKNASGSRPQVRQSAAISSSSERVAMPYSTALSARLDCSVRSA